MFSLGVLYRMFVHYCALLKLFGDISPMVLGDETLGENFNAMSWWSMAITRVRRWSFVELLAHGGAAQICVIFFIFKWEKCFLSCSLFWHYTVMASRSYYEIRRVLLWRSLYLRMQYLFFKRISLFCFYLKEIVRMISIWHESEGRLPSVFIIRCRFYI